ncbi:mast cell antigen 32, isoform CRA_b [Rattus norvegicus]|uniref:Mast cell antigen 32, isoform CRA_b n=1 Tax=Rattus norvegicus TaxID=10116 RepID=A6HK55_RAT|nr:mast cell antigen 32, isoform CRA_b [Rattus norvegicus]|eukprot:XP_017452987.1 PREDICTED: allergin-1 isoform X2 [Rattus norvegicus]
MWLGRGILEDEPHSVAAQLTMGDDDTPVCLSVASCKGVSCWLDKLLLWALTLSITLRNTAVDCRRVDRNGFLSPNLNSSMSVVRMGQNVSLSCSSKNTSIDITYSLFLGKRYLESKRRRGGAVDFHLRISNANESGPYKCKVNDSNSSKYSQNFNFTIIRCTGKTLRENESKGSGDAPTQGELYANICETQKGSEQLQEIHYTTPVFKEVAPTEQEGLEDRKDDYIYSELTY